MKIRLGYVAISTTLDNVTSSSSYTYTEYNKKKDLNKLNDIIISNFLDLKKILIYNIKNNIHFYRLTSKLIPLATHDKVEFDYIDRYSNYYSHIGEIIKDNELRVDVHPDQFCVLNSVNNDTVLSSINILKYHYDILEKMNIEKKVIILHIGSNAFGKKNSMTRFINNYNLLEDKIKKSIVLENDDKVFTVSDTLWLCKKLEIPMVLDYHHHMCNNNSEDIEAYLKEILLTWKQNTPKIHFSSPKNKTKKELRSHNDYINVYDFIIFVEKLKKLDIDVDIMLEAKRKDEALFRLVRQLKYLTDYRFIDDTTFMT